MPGPGLHLLSAYESPCIRPGGGRPAGVQEKVGSGPATAMLTWALGRMLAMG